MAKLESKDLTFCKSFRAEPITKISKEDRRRGRIMKLSTRTKINSQKKGGGYGGTSSRA
jgi:hypothetical protein